IYQDRKHNKLSSFHVYIPLTVCKSSQIFLKFLLIYPTSPIKTQEVSENEKFALFFSFCPNSLFFWLSQVVICLYSFISPGGYNEEQPYHVLVLPFLLLYLWAQRDFLEAGVVLFVNLSIMYVLTRLILSG
ncbi:hypothetical protein BDA99DRAFT_530470, partial [Phascolomyces articulosus]